MINVLRGNFSQLYRVKKFFFKCFLSPKGLHFLSVVKYKLFDWRFLTYEPLAFTVVFFLGTMSSSALIIFILIAFSSTANSSELSRCCGGGSRHYREQRTCVGLKSEGSSQTCKRAASICCLRASLEKSCELGSEMGRTQGYCSATVNILGGGLRKVF